MFDSGVMSWIGPTLAFAFFLLSVASLGGRRAGRDGFCGTR